MASSSGGAATFQRSDLIGDRVVALRRAQCHTAFSPITLLTQVGEKKSLAGRSGALLCNIGPFSIKLSASHLQEGNLARGAGRERCRKGNLKLFRLLLPNRIKSNAADPGREEAERGHADLV